MESRTEPSSAQWVLNMIGRALLAAMVVPVVIFAVAILLDQPALAPLGALLAPVVFAWQLATARMPVKELASTDA